MNFGNFLISCVINDSQDGLCSLESFTILQAG